MTSEALKYPLPWYVKVANVMQLTLLYSILAFLAVVFSPIVVPLVLYVTIGSAMSRSKFCRQMQTVGRFLNKQVLVERIATHAGTIIVDRRSFGGAHSFAWWTPDDLLAIAPALPLTDDEYRQQIESNSWQFPWDEWCWENYVSPETGKAFLLTTKNGDRLAATLLKNHPQLHVVRHWSGVVHEMHFMRSHTAK